MLLTAVALLGFASSPGGGPDPVDSVCADTPDSVMTEVTGGQTCTNLAAAGRCASTDDLVATMMAKNCKASCGGCGENRESRAYRVASDVPGDYMCKEQREVLGEAYGMPFKFLTEDQAIAKVCPVRCARTALLSLADEWCAGQEDDVLLVRGWWGSRSSHIEVCEGAEETMKICGAFNRPPGDYIIDDVHVPP